MVRTGLKIFVNLPFGVVLSKLARALAHARGEDYMKDSAVVLWL
jgi:hypothetical protein